MEAAAEATHLAEKPTPLVLVQLAIWDDKWHVWHAWADELPEARAAIAQIGAFVRQQFDRKLF